MSEAIAKIREKANAMFDCADYVCDRMDISDEALMKTFDELMEKVVFPSFEAGIKKAIEKRIEEEFQEQKRSNSKVNYADYRRPSDKSTPIRLE